MLILLLAGSFSLSASEPREIINLNGTWEFDQTQKAFPPKKFTRKIPVPGLVHLAEPKIEQYDKFFKKDNEIENNNSFNFLDRDYEPRYNWYRKTVRIGQDLEGKKVVLNILKSQFVTTVYVNGYLAGRAIESCTPLKFNITEYLDFGKDNEILIMVGDRAWLPSECAGGTDKEKKHYLSGIWDDVFLSVTGELCVDKALFLPSLEQKKVTVKTLLNNMNPPQMEYGSPTSDDCTLAIRISEKTSGKIVADKTVEGVSLRDRKTQIDAELDIPSPNAWSPESPFLYVGEISVVCNGKETDRYSDTFGIRDFKAVGKHFYLNSQKYYLRGSNVTLQRFFEDPECSNLAWDREWVKKLMIDNPKAIDWNAMRICVGIVPDFWYDLCDEYGIMLQNEWLYWQKHGWDEQIRKEYTDWVWSDGNHPSIVIWDTINENVDDFIAGTLIPEMKRLDPTRVYDAGYVTEGGHDDMDEPHPYRSLVYNLRTKEESDSYYSANPYNLGKLDDWTGFERFRDAGVPQLVNEYGWIWLWRDGRQAKLTVNNYDHYLGPDATPQQRREFQAYWLQLETEWLRAERGLAGVLSFCMLTNNYGFTGDLYIDRIKDLEKSPAYEWYKHCFAPSAVFIDMTDGRFTAHVPPFEPCQRMSFNLVGISDLPQGSKGTLVLKCRDCDGNVVFSDESRIDIPSYGKIMIPTVVDTPSIPGGYLMTAEYTPDDAADTFISRRFFKVGAADDYKYWTVNP